MSYISKDLQCASSIAKKVSELGGKTYFVGGYVRDKIMNIENKDIDIEIHGITPNQLESIIDSIGIRIEIGQSFGIYNIKGYNIDIAMPRKENVIGGGHKDFEIYVDPFMGTYEAAKRRDFTINALMEDVLSGEIIDHFNGIEDINNRIIRHVNPNTFGDDPLRVLRAAQFAARFNFTVSEDTIKISKNMDIKKLSKERIEGELKKALLKSNKPSIFFNVLNQMNHLDYWFKEIKQLIGIKQNPIYHPEGDVYTHTMMVLDNGVNFRDKISDSYSFMLSCLCHDLGKITCTKEIDGVIRSIGHKIEGIYIIKEFIKRITNEKKTLDYICNITKLHMKPNVLAKESSSIKATNKMYDQAIDKEGLIYISICDKSRDGCIDESNKQFLFDRLDIYNEYMSREYVMGKDLIECGLIPNENFKEILDYAHKLRLVGVDKNSALKQTISYAKKYYK